MTTLRTQILPTKHQFANLDVPHELNFEAICVFLATGFFLDSDTFWKDQVCLSPAHDHIINNKGFLIESKPWFDWHYTPRDISFDTALSEYSDLLTTIIKDQIGDSPVILPLSGGLDSRSQATVLKDLGNSVHSYSYRFTNGYPEDVIAKKIAKACGFSFQDFQINKGYLWNCIDQLGELNGCYSEFTHPRQMSVLPELKKMKGVFSLGHWGDVLFDRGVPEGTEMDEVIPLLLKKMVKPKGLELANQLWEIWALDGDFKDYLVGRIETGLTQIKIDNVSAKVRAFKTSQWAHRWTTTNLCVFEAANTISAPYYDNRMCQFICSIPEAYLADRRLQIAHLKGDKQLSEITWQAQTPFSINNYQYNRVPYNLPYRVWNKLQRESKGLLGNHYVQRNWELQFLGKENEAQLLENLFGSDFNTWIPKSLVQSVYKKFKESDSIQYSHSVSMLLTLSIWHKHNLRNL
jgi:hypothetical protein